ncbi:MAG: hypothetical protein ABIK43_03830 [candidate division WOR-3 bacterium]
MKKLALALLLTLVACNRNPLGADHVEQPPVRALELVPDSITAYSRYVPLGVADQLLLCHDQEYQSRVLLKFAIKDSALDSISSADLILHAGPGNKLLFACRPCSTPWRADAATWRMADDENQWNLPGGDYWNIELCRDTIGPESTVVALNLQYIDTLVRHSYGLILIPLDTGFCGIKSTGSSATAPRLQLTFSNGRRRAYSVAEDCHIMDTLAVRAYPHELYVGSGLAFRTWMRFSLDSIPLEATIVRADLVFKPTLLYRRQETLHFGCHRLTEPYRPREKNAAYRIAADARSIFLAGDVPDTLVRLDIRSLIQYWNTNPDSNFGLLVMAEPEYAFPWRVKLPRAGRSAPRLLVEYVLPPKDRLLR